MQGRDREQAEGGHGRLPNASPAREPSDGAGGRGGRPATELVALRDPQPPSRRRQLANRALVITSALGIGAVGLGSVGTWFPDFQWWDLPGQDTAAAPCLDTLTAAVAAAVAAGDTAADLTATYGSTCGLAEDSADWWIVEDDGDTAWSDFGTADSLLSWAGAGASVPLLPDSTLYVANYRAYNGQGTGTALDTFVTGCVTAPSTPTLTATGLAGDTSATLSGTAYVGCETHAESDWWITGPIPSASTDTAWSDFASDSLTHWTPAGASVPLLADSTYVAHLVYAGATLSSGEAVDTFTLTSSSPPSAPTLEAYYVNDSTVIFRVSAFSGSGGDTYDSLEVQVDTVQGATVTTSVVGPQLEDTIMPLDSGAALVAWARQRGTTGGWSAQSDSLTFFPQLPIWGEGFEDDSAGITVINPAQPNPGPDIGAGHYTPSQNTGGFVIDVADSVHRGDNAIRCRYAISGGGQQCEVTFVLYPDTVDLNGLKEVYVSWYRLFQLGYDHTTAKYKFGAMVGTGTGYDCEAVGSSLASVAGDSASYCAWMEAEPAADGCPSRDDIKYGAGTTSSPGQVSGQNVAGFPIGGINVWSECMVAAADTLGVWVRYTRRLKMSDDDGAAGALNGQISDWKGSTCVADYPNWPVGPDSTYIANGGDYTGPTGVMLNGWYDGGIGTSSLRQYMDDIYVTYLPAPGLDPC